TSEAMLKLDIQKPKKAVSWSVSLIASKATALN
ncbi:unnamed protein product, partial [marine sediment metagenome]